MQASLPKQMKAAVIDRYGGPEVLHVATIPVPEPKADEVLIRLAAAGVGVWDAEVRAGESDESHLPGLAGRRHGFPGAAGGEDALRVVGTNDLVKLHQIHVVGPEALE